MQNSRQNLRVPPFASRILSLLLLAAAPIGGKGAEAVDSTAPKEAPSNPLRVFILAGQSNMEGQAVLDLSGKDYNEGKGTLAVLLQDPAFRSRWSEFAPVGGRWPVRSDVFIRYQREEQPLLKGTLGPGFTVYGDPHHFGPEWSFGTVMGNALKEPVLLVKTAWGGKSLAADFRPPGAGGITGVYYRKMIAEIRETLARIPAEFPGLSNHPPVLSGFVWYHGWNDGISPDKGVPEYASNLAHLIRDVRRDLGVPQLPVVIGEMTGPWVEAPPEWTALRDAQASVARLPEFRGSVSFAPTRSFVRAAEQSPNPTHGHHEFGNAETILLVGHALGETLLDVLQPSLRDLARARSIEGWTVHVHSRLGTNQREATERALELLRSQLQEVRRVLPPAAVVQLQEVPLWFNPAYPGTQPGAEYHPSAAWLAANQRDPAMARGIEFSNVEIFAAEADRMPFFVLHELAHAYHDRVLSFENPQIIAAYTKARQSGRYDTVTRRFGQGKPTTREKAYALTNAREYFAECTEAYFGRNDFYPFTREELREVDPLIVELLPQLWERTGPPPP